jgi:hypothetical protein
MVERVTPAIVKSIDDVPAVCLEEDLIAIFRLSHREMRLWRKYLDFIPFPPLPMLDRQIRVSGCVVAWFLAQESGMYYRSFKSPLEEMRKGMRRNRPPWWKFAPPHAERYWATAIEGEKATIRVGELATLLRTNVSAIRRVVKLPDFPMPPATQRPLKWTAGQVERLLWAPHDHNEHLSRPQRNRPKARRPTR